MPNTYEEILANASQLNDAMKLDLASELLRQLERPDPVIESLCLAEVKARYKAHMEGRAEMLSCDEVMSPYLSPCK